MVIITYKNNIIHYKSIILGSKWSITALKKYLAGQGINVE
jgi:hypothetical protein